MMMDFGRHGGPRMRPSPDRASEPARERGGHQLYNLSSRRPPIAGQPSCEPGCVQGPIGRGGLIWPSGPDLAAGRTSNVDFMRIWAWLSLPAFLLTLIGFLIANSCQHCLTASELVGLQSEARAPVM